MKILRKYCLYALSFCMAAVMMLVPIRARAEVVQLQYGTRDVFQGYVKTMINNPILYLDLVNATSSSVDIDLETGSGIVVDGAKLAVYQGSLSGYIKIDMVKNTYVRGSQQCVTEFYFDAFSPMLYSNVSVSVNFDYTVDNIIVSSGIEDRGSGYFDTWFNVSFQDYACVNDVIQIPFTMDLELLVTYPEGYAPPGTIYVNRTLSVDSAGLCYQYTDIRDIIGIDGDFARQNQEIIDGILDNTTAVDSAKNGIVSAINSAKDSIITTINNFKAGIDTQFSHLFNNMQAWYDGLTNTINDGIDRLINNYSGTGTTDATNKFNDSAGDLEQVESDLTTITNSSIGSYTESAFDTSVITSLGSSLVYVVTWFTNFWNMGGLFTSILNVGLALSVAFFILRLRGGS